jgi:hypothetical protein
VDLTRAERSANRRKRLAGRDFEVLGISVNLAGSGSSWNEDVNLRLGAARLAEVASLAIAESVLTGLEAMSGAESTGTPVADRGAALGQAPVQVREPSSPVLPADPIAAGALRGKDSLGMPEDWFESSSPAKNTSRVNVLEPATTAPFLHANLKTGSPLDAPRLVEGFATGATNPDRPLRSNQADFETVPVQPLTAEAASGAVAAKAAAEWHRPAWRSIQPDDQLMKEIPLLFAPVPVEPQQSAIPMRLKAVVVNGLLMAGAILAAILVGTLSLKDLPSVSRMELAAAALAIIGALFLIFRRMGRRRA